jgi:transcriptional antiterminator NusG
VRALLSHEEDFLRMRAFRPGDTVGIRSGAFQSFTGRVEGINQARGLLKVMINIFGRAQAIRLKFSEAEKIDFTDDR